MEEPDIQKKRFVLVRVVNNEPELFVFQSEKAAWETMKHELIFMADFDEAISAEYGTQINFFHRGEGYLKNDSAMANNRNNKTLYTWKIFKI